MLKVFYGTHGGNATLKKSLKNLLTHEISNAIIAKHSQVSGTKDLEKCTTFEAN